jgi:hypothetical protein
MRRPLAVFTLLLLTGCSPLNQENYAQLQPGMSKAEVERLLGGPDECSAALGVASCTWGNEQRFISVQYAGDKVLMFSAKGLK